MCCTILLYKYLNLILTQQDDVVKILDSLTNWSNWIIMKQIINVM